MSCQQVPTTPAFNPYPRSVQVGEFEVAIGGGIWVAIRVSQGMFNQLFTGAWVVADTAAICSANSRGIDQGGELSLSVVERNLKNFEESFGCSHAVHA